MWIRSRTSKQTSSAAEVVAEEAKTSGIIRRIKGVEKTACLRRMSYRARQHTHTKMGISLEKEHARKVTFSVGSTMMMWWSDWDRVS
jgi:hypothetical protein